MIMQCKTIYEMYAEPGTEKNAIPMGEETTRKMDSDWEEPNVERVA